MGDSANNILFHVHYQDGGLFEVKAQRHYGNGNIDSTTTVAATRAQWADIVDVAMNGSDGALDTAAAVPWAVWYPAMITGAGLRDLFRTAVVVTVNP